MPLNTNPITEQDVADMEDSWELEGITLNASELFALGRSVGLTVKQYEAWELRVMSNTYEQIGERLSISASSAKRRIESSRRVLLRGFEMQEQYGIWDVYAEMVNRVCKARPCTRSRNPRRYEEIARLGF